MLAMFIAGFLVAMSVAFSEINGELYERREFSGTHRKFGRAFCFLLAGSALCVARYL